MIRKFFFFLLFFSGYLVADQQLDLPEKTPRGFTDFFQKKKYYLSICAVFRNEARFLKEWIEFHRLQGVEHFYLFNHLSNDDYEKVLRPYIKKNIVELFDWPYEPEGHGAWSGIQTNAYQKIIKEKEAETEWLAILDMDEFLFSVKGKNLQKFLKKYEEFGALGVNWQMYGTSGVERIGKNELMIERLTLKAAKDHGENIHVKCIVRPSYVKICKSPHFCNLKEGWKQVNEDKEIFEGPFSPYISVNKIRINHYWSRDEDFFYEVKIPRRQEWGEDPQNCIRRNENLTQETDLIMFQFIKDLKKKVFKP